MYLLNHNGHNALEAIIGASPEMLPNIRLRRKAPLTNRQNGVRIWVGGCVHREKGQRGVRVGILADSHGRADLLQIGIEVLRSRRAEKLVHLGDVTDTLRPETVDECAEILLRDGIEGVMGNHEYSLVTHHFKRYPDRFAERAKDYIRSLPYVLEIADVCFTHFSPTGGVHGLYAATDTKSYVAMLSDSSWPVLINGHSHDPHIFSRSDGVSRNVEFDLESPFKLKRGTRYVLTCGALEDRYCALFDFEERVFEVISMPA